MLSRLTLKYFRSHQAAEFHFSPGVSVIVGKNGAGKTNILESVLVLSLGKSYRASDTELIQYESGVAVVEGVFSHKKRSVKLQKQSENRVDKLFTIQEKKLKRLSFQQTIPVVLFEPDFMQIISRGPEVRRDYFDSVLSRLYPKYQTLLNQYKRILAQRNSLLKASHFTSDQLFIWNVRLSEMAGKVVEYRQELLYSINNHIQEIYSELAGKPSRVSVVYVSKTNGDSYANNLLHNLEKTILTDRERGFTSHGPHRDDYECVLNGTSAATSASRGEIRTILLSLKIIETNLIESARSEKPILLLDDVFSELDETRQAQLVQFLKSNQTIITTTSVTPLIRKISGKIFEI